MITIVYRDYGSSILDAFEDDIEDIRHYHPVAQMEIVKQAILNNVNAKFYTNHDELSCYARYLIRNKQIESKEIIMDCNGKIIEFDDRGDVILPYYSDIDGLCFGLLFGKTGDFNNLDILKG